MCIRDSLKTNIQKGLYLKPSPISIDPVVMTKETIISNKANTNPTVTVFLNEVNIALINISPNEYYESIIILFTIY